MPVHYSSGNAFNIFIVRYISWHDGHFQSHSLFFFFLCNSSNSACPHFGHIVGCEFHSLFNSFTSSSLHSVYISLIRLPFRIIEQANSYRDYSSQAPMGNEMKFPSARSVWESSLPPDYIHW